jgi:hypothetical protein
MRMATEIFSVIKLYQILITIKFLSYLAMVYRSTQVKKFPYAFLRLDHCRFFYIMIYNIVILRKLVHNTM